MLLPMAVFPSSLWPSSIPSYTCPSSSLSLLHQWHLGCFHVLATGNSAVMNLGVHVSFWIMIFFGDYIYKSSGVGLLDHVVTLLFAFQRTSVLFSPVAAPIDIPTNSVGRFLFLHTLSSIYCLFRLNGGFLTGVKGYLNVVLTCMSLISAEHFLMCLWAGCHLWRNVCLELLSTLHFN